jgi:hypothetical protein
LLEIFKGNYEHAKTFSFFFADMFVVHFVCPSHGSCIAVVGIPEQLEPLVDKNIMYQEISTPIRKNAQSDSQSDF